MNTILVTTEKVFYSCVNIINTLYYIKHAWESVLLQHERQVQIFGAQTNIYWAIFPWTWHMVESKSQPVKAAEGHQTTSTLKLDTPWTYSTRKEA